MKQSNTIKIGVTGGVGSGKSTVMDILKREYGADIILADKVAHELMEPGAASYEAIVREFGSDILVDQLNQGCCGQAGLPIDRKKLGEIVFSDPVRLKRLNDITHAAVLVEIRKRIEEYMEREAALIAVEAALLINSGLESDLDSIWYIDASREERIRRLCQSRGYTEEYAGSILDRQLTDREFREGSDVVINNEGDLAHTAAQIKKQLDKLIQVKKQSA